MNMPVLIIIFCILCLWYVRLQLTVTKETIGRYGAVVTVAKGTWIKFPDFSLQLVEKAEVMDSASDVMTYRFEVKDNKGITTVSWPSTARDASLPKFEANEIIFVLEMEYSHSLKRPLSENQLVISKRSTEAYQQKKYGA